MVKMMADLISRAAAIKAIKPLLYSGNCVSTLINMPAVDAVSVVHARWINYPECLGYDGAYTNEHIVCSACHSVWNIIDNDADRFDYCPTCGAKMDGERRESE
jgi:hypothetical protein